MNGKNKTDGRQPIGGGEGGGETVSSATYHITEQNETQEYLVWLHCERLECDTKERVTYAEMDRRGFPILCSECYENRENPPVVECTASRRHRKAVWRLDVLNCPFCGESHRHGGGRGPEPYLGHRWAHCRGDRSGRGYVLELATDD